MKKTKAQKIGSRITGVVGVVLLMLVLPLSMMQAKKAYTLVDSAPSRSLLAPALDGDGTAPQREVNTLYKEGALLVQIVVIDPFTGLAERSWSEVLAWPAVSNQQQRVQFEGEQEAEEISFTISEAKWGLERSQDDVPYWQRKELQLRNGTIRESRKQREVILRTSVSAEYSSRNRHASGSRSVGEESFEHLFSLSTVPLRAALSGYPSRGAQLMISVKPLASATAVRTVGVEMYVPELAAKIAEDQRDDTDYLRHSAGHSRMNTPHGFKLFGAQNMLFLMAFIGVIWACGLFKHAGLALCGLYLGMIFYLGAVDRMQTAYHLEKLGDDQEPRAVRLVAAAMSGRSFFHLGDVHQRLSTQHNAWAGEHPELANALLASGDLASRLAFDAEAEYIDSELLRAALRTGKPEVMARMEAWTQASPLRDYYEGRFNGGFSVRRQVMSCTTNQLSFVQLSEDRLFPQRRIQLPAGVVLRGVELGAEVVALQFQLTDHLAAVAGRAEGVEYEVKIPLRELIGFENDDHNRMVFSPRGQPDVILDYVNTMLLLKRAKVTVAEISPVMREVVAERSDMAYRLKLNVPYNYRVVTPDRDVGEVHVYRLTEQEPRIQVQVKIYIGSDPQYPFDREPRDAVEVQGRYDWKQFTRNSGKNETVHLVARHQPEGDGPLIYMEISGGHELERAAMRQICESMDILAAERP